MACHDFGPDFSHCTATFRGGLWLNVQYQSF
jgi:hypothetical protein